jgi:hypothetical protein
VRCRVEHIGRPTTDYLFADQMEVKRLEHVSQESPVFLVLA